MLAASLFQKLPLSAGSDRPGMETGCAKTKPIAVGSKTILLAIFTDALICLSKSILVHIMKNQGACAITPAQLREANVTTCATWFLVVVSSLEVSVLLSSGLISSFKLLGKERTGEKLQGRKLSGG